MQALTGVPTVAVLPMWRGHGLPEEDGVFDDGATGPGRAQAIKRIAIVAYPRISNLDEFQPLRSAPGVRLVWARCPADLDGADWVILPGSKHSTSDLAWLRAQGLDAAIQRHAAAGGAVLGICGGLQMLGQALVDADGVEAHAPTSMPGLGLLPLVTTFERDKLLLETQASFGQTTHAWSGLSRAQVQGYEIHHGRTAAPEGHAGPPQILHNEQGEPLGWQQGAVMGLYLHGLFESPAAMQALFGLQTPSLDAVFDGLADFIDQHFSAGTLLNLLLQAPTA